MTAMPFLSAPSPDASIAWRAGAVVSWAEFLRDVALLAARLPDRQHVLNDCDDRYHFAVGLAAALARGQVSLFPSSRTATGFAELSSAYPDLYCLSDKPEEETTLTTVQYATPVDGPRAALPDALPADRLAAIFFTSGSTGSPQPQEKTWRAIIEEADLAGRHIGLVRGRAGAIIATVPPQHLYGFTMSVLLPWRFGYLLSADRPFFPEDVRRAVDACPHPPVLVTTPLQLRAIVRDNPQLAPLDFILSSTAPLDADTAAAAEAAFATRVLEIYGSSETGAIAWRRQQEGPVWHAFDGIRLRKSTAGLEVAAAYLPIGIMLADQVDLVGGHDFLLLGRSADLIKIGGKRASLSELNRQLLAVEGVVDGAFFCPEASGQEQRLTAFVVAPAKTGGEILAVLRERIDPVFLPRPLRLVTALPRNATGKLPRAQLVQLWEEETRRETAVG